MTNAEMLKKAMVDKFGGDFIENHVIVCGCGLVEEKPVDAATPAEKVPVTADVIAEIKDTIADVATEGYKKQELPTFFMVGGGELSNTLAQILRATSLAKFSKDQKQENMDAFFSKPMMTSSPLRHIAKDSRCKQPLKLTVETANSSWRINLQRKLQKQYPTATSKTSKRH